MKFTIKYSFLFFLFANLCVTDLKAEWTKVAESTNGQSFYVDIRNIKEEEGHVFFWELIDYKFKDEYGDLSAKIYIKADCIKMRFKWLKLSYHKDSMGKDMVLDQKPSKLVAKWQYPKINSTSMTVLEFVCKNKGITL
ncbi:MAG: surface-adhesin E family protein [Pseudomonadota bacterium]|nr:surface-adhesin E family protein [Pseudomonadota bacterium]